MESTVDVAATPERVAAGAEWLDRESPRWWAVVKLDRLDMANCYRCVLGQLYGDYYDVSMRLDQAVALGFDTQLAPEGDHGDLTEDQMYDAMRAEFDALGAEWGRVIEARRAQAVRDV